MNPPAAPEGARDVELTLPITHEVVLSGHTRAVSAVALDPGGARLISGALDFTCRLFDFGGMDRSHRAFKEITPQEGEAILGISYSPNGDRFVVATGGSKAIVFDRDGNHCVTCIRGDPYINDVANTKGHISGVTSVHWHPTDRDIIMTSGKDSSIRFWNLNGKTVFDELLCGDIIKCKNAKGQRVPVTTAAISPDGKVVVGGCEDGSLQLFVVKNNGSKYVRPDGVIRDAHGPGEISCVVFSPDGAKVATRSVDDTLKIWDTTKFNERAKPLAVVTELPNLGSTTNCAWSPDGSVLIAGSNVPKGRGDGKVYAFEVSKIVATSHRGLLAETAASYSMAVCKGHSAIHLIWHAKINQIVVGCGDGNIRVLYNPELSVKGALLSVAKAPKRRDVSDDAVMDPGSGAIFTPELPPLFWEEEERGERRKFVELNRHPAKSMLPQLPISDPDFVHKGARSFTQFYIQTHNKTVNLRSEDPAEVLRSYAKKARVDAPEITRPYTHTQPKPVLAEKTIEEEEAEAAVAEMGIPT